MKRRNKFYLLLVFTFFKVTVSLAQIDTAFWFAAPWVTPDHHWKDDYVVHISTFGTPTTVRLRQPSAIAPNRYDTTINIPANSTFDYKFWRDKLASSTNFGFDSLESRPANTVLPYGLYISSTTPNANITVVYDVITRGTNFPTVTGFLNPETFSLKGQNGLGTEFICPFQTKWNNQTLGDLNGDGINTQPKQQINIVASKPNTVVWITPKTNVVGHLAGVTYSVLLPSYGSVYTIENLTTLTSAPGNNLSGTIVTSDKPISVTVADDSVRGVTGCFDLMGDQIVPTDVIGNRYILNRGFMNAAEYQGAYIVGTQNFTYLSIVDAAGTTTAYINKGETYYYKTNQNLTYIDASKPVYCLHATGTGCELGEAIIPPLDCAGSQLVAFSRNTNQNFYLNVVCTTSATNAFAIGSSTGTLTIPISPSNFTLVPGTGTLYSGAQLSLASLTLAPIDTYTIRNTVDVFALGILDGGGSTGGLFHYMSSFVRKPIVQTIPTQTICSTTPSVMLTGTVSNGAITGSWTAITANSGTFGVPTSTLGTVSIPFFINTQANLDSIRFMLKSLGSCKEDSAYIKVFINKAPQVVITNSVAPICTNNLAPVVLTGTVLNASSAIWSGGNGAIGPPGPITSYTPSVADVSAGLISLTLTSQAPLTGCTNVSQSFTIGFTNPPVIAASNVNACTNQAAITLTASVSGSTLLPTWNSNGTGIFFPTNQTVSPTYSFSSSDYTMSIITLTASLLSGNNCAAVNQIVSINLTQEPTVLVPNNFTVCASAGAVVLNGTVTGAATSGSWSAVPGTGGAFAPIPPSSASYTLTQNDTLNGSIIFQLSSTPGLCPSKSNTVQVSILKAPLVTVNSNNSSVCRNANIALTGTVSGYTNSGSWSSTGTGAFTPTNTALTGAYIPSPGDVANGSVILTLASTNNQGCPAKTASFTAIFVDSPKAAFAPAQILCKDAPVFFANGSQANGTSNLTYNWNFGANTPSVSITENPLVTFPNIGSYVITLTVSGTNSLSVRCSDTVSRRIIINPLPVVDFTFTNACSGNETKFTDLSLVTPGNIIAWSWDFNDASPLGTIKNPIQIYNEPKTYNVTLVATSNKSCTASMVKQVNVAVKPNAEFGMTNNPSVAQEPVYFSDFSTPSGQITNWFWSFGDENSGTGNAPQNTYLNPGSYVITLQITDDKGCRDTTSKRIEVNLLPQVPTAFTPNSDSNNDKLFVKGGPFEKMIFRVYNNWGELVFETEDQKVGWDGTKNGVAQPVGVYVWTLVVDMYNNRQVKKNGDITLIR